MQYDSRFIRYIAYAARQLAIVLFTTLIFSQLAGNVYVGIGYFHSFTTFGFTFNFVRANLLVGDCHQVRTAFEGNVRDIFYHGLLYVIRSSGEDILIGNYDH